MLILKHLLTHTTLKALFTKHILTIFYSLLCQSSEDGVCGANKGAAVKQGHKKKDYLSPDK